jgi:hypothetical protein
MCYIESQYPCLDPLLHALELLIPFAGTLRPMPDETRPDAVIELPMTSVGPGDDLTYRLHNTGSVELICGVGYQLERESNGQWLPAGPPMWFPAIGLIVRPGEHRQLTAKIPADAPDGLYRINTSLSDRDGRDVEASAEFRVTGQR